MRPPGRFHSREHVLVSVPDKAALASSWGLRLARQVPNPKGGISCHSIYREDEHPSASFSPTTGVYTEDHGDVCLSLFDMAAVLGAYPNWHEAKIELGRRFMDGPSHAGAGETATSEVQRPLN